MNFDHNCNGQRKSYRFYSWRDRNVHRKSRQSNDPTMFGIVLSFRTQKFSSIGPEDS